MSRTQYENSESKHNENEFKKYIELRWSCNMVKMHYHHIIDFMLLKNKVAKAWVEVKCLNRTYKQYPHFILSLSKYMKGVEYYRVTGLPFIFATRIKDGDYFYKYDESHIGFPIIYGGRTKTTRDKYDIEPIIQIPLEHFKEL